MCAVRYGYKHSYRHRVYLRMVSGQGREDRGHPGRVRCASVCRDVREASRGKVFTHHMAIQKLTQVIDRPIGEVFSTIIDVANLDRKSTRLNSSHLVIS